MALTAQTRNAIIIGGSMSGLLCGLILRRAGWNVDVFERVESELAGRGAGIVAQPALVSVLRSFGVETHDLGVNVQKRRILDRSGDIIAERDCPQILTTWERVYRILRDLFGDKHYTRAKLFTRFEQDAASVTAYFSDGEKWKADLLVGADGLRSTLRGQCLPDTGPLYAGYVAWRALLFEANLPEPSLRDVFPYMTFGLPPGEQFLAYPVAGLDDDLRPGHRRLNVIWYRPAEEHTELRDLLTDETGTTHPLSIPPPLIRRAAIEAMRDAAERLLAPQLRVLVRMIEEPILQPIYDLETPQMAFGRVALIGDAAFLIRPHVGAGVSKAADDALALAEALTGTDVESGLKRFEAMRLPIGRRIVEQARHLGAYLQATKSQEEQRSAKRYSTNEAVLRETALVDFLDN
ncbi:MAG TPA: FAD binding domain-containing protein [Xanthobacteraceae bacterium]|jgi:2-polyprenyl-6-methoxyphenol hydroxylase-like FAD-dependent oxidoreductase|nr:FAD binding domain-containing protein [Xanthobacteraceae bacterium]